MRLHFHRAVLVLHARHRVFHVRAQPSQDGEIVLVAVAEDVVLYLVVALRGIVVEVFQSVLCAFVDVDIVLHLLLVVLHRVADVHGIGQTHVTVNLRLFAQAPRLHRLQRVDERVVACNLRVKVFNVVAEGHRGLLELPELFRGLVAGIRLVKHVPLFLRIEHQRVLVATLQRLDEFPEGLLVALLRQLRVLFLVVVGIGEFLPEDVECLLKVLFFEHGLCLHECSEE